MTIEDFFKVTAAAGSAPLTILLFKWLTDRKASVETTNQERIKTDATLQVAALGSYKELIEAYQEREKQHAEEVKALKQELTALREQYVSVAPKVSLLLVDDDDGTVASIRRLLRNTEYSVTVCGSWAAAELHLSASPDVALIDLWLPDSEPANTVKRVADYRKEHPSVPIALVTGKASLEHIVPPIGVRIANKADVLVSGERLRQFLANVMGE